MSKISVVINTLNEEKNITRAITSVKSFADEIVVVDMESEDETSKIAKKLGARVYSYKKMGYVEPARNYAISKTVGDWVFILDADEIIPETLGTKIKEIVEKSGADYYRVSRKNVNFGKWMKHSRWWPDYNIRFFRKGSVAWNKEIHSIPITTGVGADLEAEEKFAIIHYNYLSIESYLERMNRYTTVQSNELIAGNHKFIWKDLVDKPFSEFLSRFFFGEGYKDGLHGLAFSLLQAFSELIVYLKVWQKEKFMEETITIHEIEEEVKKKTNEAKWWVYESHIKNNQNLPSLMFRVKQKLVSSK